MSDDALDRAATRKRVELEEKLNGMRTELAHWTAETAHGKPLRKHQSQIERLTHQLGGMIDAVATQLTTLPNDADRLLGASRSLQLRVLEVHRLWDYFRSKLSLRYVTWFADYLAAADDLAWECFEPARVAAASSPQPPAVRAAPLVFLTGEFSPYTHARRTPYEVEPLTDVADSATFRAIAADLPVPVVGMPWYQVAHLPDAVLIGHEIGHDVEQELGLTAAMEAHLARVLQPVGDPERAFAWTTWRAELFADLYGVLCTGPAFVSAMADLLASDPLRIADEARSPETWSAHPPASLRMRGLTHALGLLDFEDEAQALREAWEMTFPPAGGDPFIADVPTVVDALWHGEYEQLGGPLHSAITFSVAQQRDATGVARTVLAAMEPQAGDIRCLIAGARLAFDANPEGFRSPPPGKPTAQGRILRRVLDLRDDEPRNEEIGRAPGPAADREAGIALLARLQNAIVAKQSLDPEEEG